MFQISRISRAGVLLIAGLPLAGCAGFTSSSDVLDNYTVAAPQPMRAPPAQPSAPQRLDQASPQPAVPSSTVWITSFLVPHVMIYNTDAGFNGMRVPASEFALPLEAERSRGNRLRVLTIYGNRWVDMSDVRYSTSYPGR